MTYVFKAINYTTYKSQDFSSIDTSSSIPYLPMVSNRSSCLILWEPHSSPPYDWATLTCNTASSLPPPVFVHPQIMSPTHKHHRTTLRERLPLALFLSQRPHSYLVTLVVMIISLGYTLILMWRNGKRCVASYLMISLDESQLTPRTVGNISRPRGSLFHFLATLGARPHRRSSRSCQRDQSSPRQCLTHLAPWKIRRATCTHHGWSQRVRGSLRRCRKECHSRWLRWR